MRSIAVINHKGGVGKTTTAVNLGHALALQGQRVALIDLDPQGHLAVNLGIFRPPANGMDKVMLEGAHLLEHAVATREMLQLVPAGSRLCEVDSLPGGSLNARRLQMALLQPGIDLDFLVFDCPPSAGRLVANAVLAADDVLVPVAGDYLSLTGVAKLMVTLKRFESLRDRRLRMAMFMSRFTPRRRLSAEVKRKLQQHFPRHLLDADIAEAAVVADAAAAGRTLFEYRPHCKAAAEFIALRDAFINRRTGKHAQQETRDVA